ncbi:REP-associated tyrosine transposase [Thiothrix winogradskyi]|uniref:Transposase n=1 Tax=Thiothrix winogradskyi TaxID=96472 RepID=A0ABY3SXW4_9GAMM|nr:transposase [Thiothrix winogradskyi]UJS23729.1 transposase [Thiothrix winogradskyi]
MLEARYHQGNALRKGRISIPQQVYSITIVTRERVPVFAEWHAARSLIQVLREHDINGDTQTLCFVVMPDHLHWLMQLGNRKTLSATVQSVKSLTSKCCGWSIWQRGFHDRAIRQGEDITTVARYIINNPVRAGLVESVREYSHWDAVWVKGDKS